MDEIQEAAGHAAQNAVREGLHHGAHEAEKLISFLVHFQDRKDIESHKVTYEKYGKVKIKELVREGDATAAFDIGNERSKLLDHMLKKTGIMYNFSKAVGEDGEPVIRITFREKDRTVVRNTLDNFVRQLDKDSGKQKISVREKLEENKDTVEKNKVLEKQKQKARDAQSR